MNIERKGVEPKQGVGMTSCFICGRKGSTEEHIIPKWLQKKFNLWNMNLTLINETKISYKSLKVPCCFSCNNRLLSKLEKRVQSGNASDEEIWKWAAKIHFGILRKDDFLEWDRKNPKYKIGEIVRTDDPLELDRHLVHSIHGEFKTDPAPFGSVYRFEFDRELEFYFCHVFDPDAICINTGKIGYVVFLRDTGSLRRTPSIQEMYKQHNTKSHVGKMLNFFANAWMHLHRFKVSYHLILSDNFIGILGSGKVVEERPFDIDLYKKVWRFLNHGKEMPILSNEEYERQNGGV